MRLFKFIYSSYNYFAHCANLKLIINNNLQNINIIFSKYENKNIIMLIIYPGVSMKKVVIFFYLNFKKSIMIKLYTYKNNNNIYLLPSKHFHINKYKQK